MKKISCLLVSLLMLLGMLGAIPVAAAGGVSVSANKSTVTIGETVTVTATYTHPDGIGSMDLYFHYNTKAFEYVSSNPGASGAGKLKISYYATEAVAPTSVTVTITLKAVAAGSGDFKLETAYIATDEDDTALEGDVRTLSVSANNPTLSGDADLTSLKPSKGTLNPQFNKNTTNYTVSVPYTVTSVSLICTTSHPDADTAVSGKNALAVGKNTRVVTVTAPNGNTKKYTVVITREEQKTTAATTTTPPASTSTTQPTESTTLPVPAEDALLVKVDGKDMLIADIQPQVDLPTGFRWESLTINEVEVPAAKQEATGITLLYLTEKDAETGAFYIYTAETDTFALFRQMLVKKRAYIIHDLPKSETGPEGAELGTVSYEGGNIPAYLFLNPDMADYAIVWATNPQGETGFYTYDMVEGTLQRYHVIEAPTTTTTAPVEDEPVVADPVPKQNAFVAFVDTYQQTILICAAALAGLAVLIVTIVLLIRLLASAGNKGKH